MMGRKLAGIVAIATNTFWSSASGFWGQKQLRIFRMLTRNKAPCYMAWVGGGLVCEVGFRCVARNKGTVLSHSAWQL
jgi:hypothetical protein